MLLVLWWGQGELCLHIHPHLHLLLIPSSQPIFMSTCYMSGPGWGPQGKKDTGPVLTILISSIFLLAQEAALHGMHQQAPLPSGLLWISPIEGLGRRQRQKETDVSASMLT